MSRRVVLVHPLPMLLLLALAVLALARPPAAQAQKGKTKGHALLVGARDYEHAALSTLKYTENDVEQLAKLLDKPGSPFHGRVRVLTCTRGKKDTADRPTAQNIRRELKKLLEDRTRHDMVLLALS